MLDILKIKEKSKKGSFSHVLSKSLLVRGTGVHCFHSTFSFRKAGPQRTPNTDRRSTSQQMEAMKPLKMKVILHIIYNLWEKGL